MRFTSRTSSGGVTEQLFTLTFSSGEIPGVLRLDASLTSLTSSAR